jgi:predicted dienelactone hydrolase
MHILLFVCLLQEKAPDPGKLGALAYAEFAETIALKAGDREALVVHPKDEKGPFPVIVLSPGGQAGTVKGYEGFARWFASWGFVTVVVAFNSDTAEERAGQFSEVLDWLEKKNGADGWALKGRLDAKKFVAAGHSRGGYAAVVAAKKEKRIAACVAMCPSGPEKLEGENQPAWLLVSGDQGDETTCAAIYKQAAKPRFNVTVAGMDHFFSPKGKAEVVVRVATAFLNYRVKGDARYKEHLAKGDGVAVESEE